MNKTPLIRSTLARRDYVPHGTLPHPKKGISNPSLGSYTPPIPLTVAPRRFLSASYRPQYIFLPLFLDLHYGSILPLLRFSARKAIFKFFLPPSPSPPAHIDVVPVFSYL